MDTIENGTLSIFLHTDPEAPATRVEDCLAAGTAKLTVRCLGLPRRSLDSISTDERSAGRRLRAAWSRTHDNHHFLRASPEE